MKILGIDSSGLVASAAILSDDTVVSEFTVNNKKTHSQTLLPMIEQVVKMAGIELEELDAIAVAAGPGSFTGLRIGSSTAKGMALALKKPILSIPTLEGLAYRLTPVTDELVCPLMDARRNQVYTGIYQNKKEGIEAVRQQEAVAIEELIEQVNALERPVVFLGDGVPVQKEALEANITVPYRFAPAHLNRQSASAVAALGVVYYKEGKSEDARDHKPIYLRQSQAERERERRTGMIDRLQEKDIDQVAQIEAEIFSVPWSIKSFKDALASEQNIYLKAETDGQIVGYCGIWTSFESADLCNIAVKKEFRKAGLGQKLLEAGIQAAAAKGVERILLEVRQSNKAAIRLYEKNGFQTIGLRKSYYTKPVEDAILMERFIRKMAE